MEAVLIIFIYRTSYVERTERAQVFGAQYKDPPRPEIKDYNVPCAVCLVPRKLLFMMPGTNECADGWTTEYVGQITAEATREDRHRGEFVCMDDDAEIAPYNNLEEGGVFMYPAQVRCGSLPCLPYEENKDLLCVVCSR